MAIRCDLPWPNLPVADSRWVNDEKGAISMPDFRAYLLDRSGGVLSCIDLAAGSLTGAKTHAYRVLRSRRETAYGLEIWRGAERLFPSGPRPAIDPGEDFVAE
jgi:hypothetical protein